MKSTFVSLLSLVLITVPAWAGSLEPPGAPAPTMKTIADAEPRTPIHASDFPLTISASGSYYLAENVLSSSTAITISAEYVSLDLSGFTLGSAATPFSISGGDYVTLRNGHLIGSPSPISLTLGDHATLDKLTVLNSRVTLGTSAQTSNCSFEGSVPLFVCGAYCIVENSRFSAPVNGTVSIGSFSLLSGVEISNAGGLVVGAHTVISHSTMFFDDVQLFSTGGSVSVLNSSFSCSGDECVNLGDDSHLANCVVRGGVTRGVVMGRRSRVESAEILYGLTVGDGSMVKDCLLEGHGSIALSVGSDSMIIGNKCTDGGPGIQVTGSGNRIEGNTLVLNNTFGLRVLGTGNTIHRNSASKNPSGNYQIASGNDAGPIGTAATASSPWANISY